MPSITKKYSDIDLTFVPHPVSGDVTILRDERAVQRALRNLMFMGYFDRPFEPDLGANLRQMLHDNMTPLIEKSIDMQIRGAISRYEPRVSVLDLSVEADYENNGYNVILKYVVDAISSVQEISTFLERIR